MLTIQQLADRETYLGASEAAAIVGLNPFKSAHDVWLERLGMVEDFAGNSHTDAGNRLENAVLLWALDELGSVSSERAPFLRHAEHEWMGANLDLRAVLPDGERVIVEAKVSGVTSPLYHDAWGESGSADVPEQYVCQVQHQLAVAGPEYQRAFLAALLPPRGFVLYVISRMDDAIEAIIEKEREFWFENIAKRIPPDDAPSYSVVKRLKRLPGKETAVPGELVAEILRLQAMRKHVEDQLDAAKSDLLLRLGDAEIGVFDGGKCTYREITRKAYSVAETKYRSLRIQQGK